LVVAHDPASFHNKTHILQAGDILERIALNSNNVCYQPRLYSTKLIPYS